MRFNLIQCAHLLVQLGQSQLRIILQSMQDLEPRNCVNISRYYPGYFEVIHN